MRGSDETTRSLFAYVDIEARIPAKHSLELTRGIVNDVLTALDCELAARDEPTGRDSLPPLGS